MYIYIYILPSLYNIFAFVTAASGTAPSLWSARVQHKQTRADETALRRYSFLSKTAVQRAALHVGFCAAARHKSKENKGSDVWSDIGT